MIVKKYNVIFAHGGDSLKVIQREPLPLKTRSLKFLNHDLIVNKYNCQVQKLLRVLFGVRSGFDFRSASARSWKKITFGWVNSSSVNSRPAFLPQEISWNLPVVQGNSVSEYTEWDGAPFCVQDSWF